jgi:hypothetical protein
MFVQRSGWAIYNRLFSTSTEQVAVKAAGMPHI